MTTGVRKVEIGHVRALATLAQFGVASAHCRRHFNFEIRSAETAQLVEKIAPAAPICPV